MLNQVTLIGPKKVVLFPEMRRVKIFLSFTRPHCRMCIRIYIFHLENKTKKTRRQKAKETKEEKRIADTIISFANLLCVLLTYLIES